MTEKRKESNKKIYIIITTIYIYNNLYISQQWWVVTPDRASKRPPAPEPAFTYLFINSLLGGCCFEPCPEPQEGVGPCRSSALSSTFLEDVCPLRIDILGHFRRGRSTPPTPALGILPTEPWATPPEGRGGDSWFSNRISHRNPTKVNHCNIYTVINALNYLQSCINW